MITNTQIDLSLQWPLFEQKQKTSKRKFWEKDKKPIPQNQQFLIEGDLMRVSQKNAKPKSYYFRLTYDYILYYFKKQTDMVPKGHLELNEYIQINVEQITLKKSKDGLKPIAISILTYNQDQYKLYHDQGILIFDWWSVLILVCTINNFQDMYFQMELLGQGSFAAVYKVRRLLDSQLMAAKYYYKNSYEISPSKERMKRMIENESRILRQISHPGIIQLHEMYQQQDKIVLVMEYVPGKDLYQLIKDNQTISERKASVIIHNLADALFALTEAGFVHRDLKLENILVVNVKTLETKLVDFGFAEPINRASLTSKAGTPGYIAPEVFQDMPYEESGDMFSLGVILFSIVGGYSPFKGKTYQKIMQENKAALIVFDKQVWTDVSSECKQLIRDMTCINPKNRITFKSLLNHKWLLPEFHSLRIKQRVSIQELRFIDYPANELGSIKGDQFGPPKSFYISSAKTIKSNRSQKLPHHSEFTPMSLNKQRGASSGKQINVRVGFKMDDNKDLDLISHFDFESYTILELDQIDSIGTSNIQFLRSGNVIFNKPKIILQQIPIKRK